MASLSKLPPELLLDILGYLDNSDLLTMAQTARYLSNLALETLYDHPKLPIYEGPDFKHNRSHRRVVNLTLSLLQNPNFSNKVRGLDIDLTFDNFALSQTDYYGHGSPITLKSSPKRHASLKQLLTTARRTVAKHTRAYEKSGRCVHYPGWEHRLHTGHIVPWTYLLLILTPNLKTLRLGDGCRLFVNEWRRWMCLPQSQSQDSPSPTLADLPGPRSVQRIFLGGNTRPDWEWMTLPSLHSYAHEQNKARIHRVGGYTPWPAHLTSPIQALHTNECIVLAWQFGIPHIEVPDLFKEDSCSKRFEKLKAVRIGGLTAKKTRRYTSTGFVVEGLFERMERLSRRLASLAETLEVLELVPEESEDMDPPGVWDETATRLQSFTRLKRLGVPAYSFAPTDVRPLHLENGDGNGVEEHTILRVEMLPGSLEDLMLFQNHGATPWVSYTECVVRVAQDVLLYRDRVPMLGCIGIEDVLWESGLLLARDELREVGIRMEVRRLSRSCDV